MKLLVVVLLVLAAAPAFAQVSQLEAHAGGVTCGTCFNTALMMLKQLPGVSDAGGDPREGWIRISVDPKKGISLEDAVSRIHVAGFKDDLQISIMASGTLEQRGSRRVLVVPNQKELFVVDSGDHEKMVASAAVSGHRVTATGLITGSGKQYEVKVSRIQQQ